MPPAWRDARRPSPSRSGPATRRSRKAPRGARGVIPRAYIEMIFVSKSGNRRWYLAISRSEEHTSELQSLMRISYAVFCLKKKKKQQNTEHNENTRHSHTTTR